MSNWTIDDARRTYNIAHWSSGYFDINAQGNICVLAGRDEQVSLDLKQIVEQASESLTLPLLLRFSHILQDRVSQLCHAFSKAMQANHYQGSYTAVYPIKVNQQRSVVDQINAEQNAQVGLEAGSKPELMAVMALSRPGGVIVCNGYKDREYIRLALIGNALGHRVYIVVEKPSELQLVLEESRQLHIKPLLGVRVKLASIGAGKWQNTGGEKSKFGLTATQILQCIHTLTEADMLDSLQMLHFHLGSQLANIRDIQRGLRECARYYAELYSQNVNINCIDVGGGLGIDYEGTRSRSFCSINYSIDEYANNVVHAFWEVCEEHGLPHPNIFSESGRALTAHHAVLVTNVIDTGQVTEADIEQAPTKDDPIIMHDMWQRYQELAQLQNNSALLEIYHDIHYGLSEAQTMYIHGVLNLAQRAHIEDIYFACCRRLRTRIDPAAKHHREMLDELNEKLADKYFCNFSLFQSLPDVWAIDQIFPVVPIHRLDEKPTRRAVIEDITCDSDGRIDQYVDSEGIETSLPLHIFQRGDTYILGIFLVGAYQEILGDMHNLFGDTDSIDVELTADGGYRLSHPLRGDTVDSVLRYVHFDAAQLLDQYRHKVTQAISDQSRAQALLEEIENGLYGYTYLEE